MKRILCLVTLFMFIFGMTCFSAGLTKEKAEAVFGSCAGTTVWIDRRSALWAANVYIDRATKLLEINGVMSEKAHKKALSYMNVAKLFGNLEQATIGIIDFDNDIIMINKQNGTSIALKNASNDDLADMFTLGILLTDYPFDNGESEEDINDIKNGKMHIGFNKDQAALCWGFPSKKNKTTTAYGTSEQWVYEGDSIFYLYLENGHVTAWQT